MASSGPKGPNVKLPKGPNGPNGPNGPKGPNGPNGRWEVTAVVVAAVLLLLAVALVGAVGAGPDTVEEPESIVFSSGGMKGAAHAGVLVFMHEHGLMRRATKFAGSSVGAVIAAACALRMDVREIVRLWSELDYVALMTPHESDASASSGRASSGRTSSGCAMHELFRGFIGRETGDPDITFRGLHSARGTTLVVAVTCVSLRRCVYFTHTDEEYADTPVALALRMSCSLPFVLEPVSYKGLLFADGAITDALPLEALVTLGGPLKKSTLAVVVMSADDRVGGPQRREEGRPGMGHRDIGTERPKGPEGPKGPKGPKGPEGPKGPKAPKEPEGPADYAAMLLESAMRSRAIRVPSDANARVLYVRTNAGCGITRVQNEDTGALVRRGYEEARRFFSRSSIKN